MYWVGLLELQVRKEEIQFIYKKKLFFFKIKFDCLYFFLNKIFLLKKNNILIEMCDFNFFKR